MHAKKTPARRARQVRPTQTELNRYWALLRTSADAGDTQAAAALIALSENKSLPSALGFVRA